MPALADVYGLYYNTDHAQGRRLLRRRRRPPPSCSTWRSSSPRTTPTAASRWPGSCRCGASTRWCRPTSRRCGARTGPTGDGKSAFSTDPHWAAMLQWQKKFVDAIGYDKLRRFTSGAGDSRVRRHQPLRDRQARDEPRRGVPHRVHHSEHPELQYATAPFPVDDDQANLYGAGYVTGNSLGIPRTSTGRNREAAWQLVKYLSTDPAAQVLLAQKLKNVPTLTASLSDPASPRTRSSPPSCGSTRTRRPRPRRPARRAAPTRTRSRR